MTDGEADREYYLSWFIKVMEESGCIINVDRDGQDISLGIKVKDECEHLCVIEEG